MGVLNLNSIINYCIFKRILSSCGLIAQSLFLNVFYHSIILLLKFYIIITINLTLGFYICSYFKVHNRNIIPIGTIVLMLNNCHFKC